MIPFSKVSLFVCVLALFAITPLDTVFGQWSQFRGPNGSGISESSILPAKIDPSANLEWRKELPPGHSSPVVFEERVYVTAFDDGLVTICCDLRTGTDIWRTSAPDVDINLVDARNHPASPSAAVDSSGVYVFFPDLGLFAYTLDGAPKWNIPLGPFNNIYGLGASPVIVDELIILPIDQQTDSYLFAVDKNTGAPKWNTPRPEATSGHCTPIVIRDENNHAIVLQVGSFFVTAYDAQTGEKIWWVGGLCFEMKSTPVIAGDLLFVNGYGSPANQPGQTIDLATFQSTLDEIDANDDRLIEQGELTDRLQQAFFPVVDLNSDGKLDSDEWSYFRAALKSQNSMMAIRLGGGEGDLTDENVVWKYHRNIPQLPSPVLCGGRLYMVDDKGIVTCFNPQTGDVLARGRLDGANGEFYASPVVGDNKLFFVSLDGKTATLANDGSLTPIANGDLEERCFATPALTSDRVLVRTEKALYSFRKSDNE